MKIKAIFLTLTVVTTLLVLGVIAPFSIGMVIEHKLNAKMAALHRAYPEYQITLKGYKRGLYGSTATLDITVPMIITHTNSPIKISMTENITHGPVIFCGGDTQFALANITSHITIQHSDALHIDQANIPFTSLVHYNGTLSASLNIDKISGKLTLPTRTEDALDTTLAFSINHLNTMLSLDSHSALPSYQIRAKEIALRSDAEEEQVFKVTNLNMQNDVTGALQSTALHHSCIIDELDLQLSSEDIWRLKGLKTNLTLNENKKKYNVTAMNYFTELNVNNQLYGPGECELTFNKVPSQLFSTLQSIGISTLEEQEIGFTSLANSLQQDLDIEVFLNSFKLQLPGGELNVHGNYHLIANADDEKMDFAASHGKLCLNISKRAMDNLVKTWFSREKMDKKALRDTVINTIDYLTTTGLLIDTGKQYESYLVYKDEKPYLNGANYFDKVSKDLNIALKRPLSPEQELLLSIWADDFAKVKSWIEQGADPLAHHVKLKNPLQAAAIIGNPAIVNLLLESEIPIDQTDYTGSTALYWATRHGHQDIVEMLLCEGADPNLKNTHGWTPLQEAAENGYQEIMISMLQHNIDVNAIDNEGRTALFWAAKNGHAAIINLLLEKGADPNIANVRGVSPADIALKEKHNSTVVLLQSLNEKKLAEHNFKEMATLLINNNADINKTDTDGRTVLFWAAINGNNEIIQLLLDKGADPTIANIRGLKPIDIAKERGHNNTAALLEKAMENRVNANKN